MIPRLPLVALAVLVPSLTIAPALAPARGPLSSAAPPACR